MPRQTAIFNLFHPRVTCVLADLPKLRPITGAGVQVQQSMFGHRQTDLVAPGTTNIRCAFFVLLSCAIFLAAVILASASFARDPMALNIKTDDKTKHCVGHISNIIYINKERMSKCRLIKDDVCREICLVTHKRVINNYEIDQKWDTTKSISEYWAIKRMARESVRNLEQVVRTLDAKQKAASRTAGSSDCIGASKMSDRCQAILRMRAAGFACLTAGLEVTYTGIQDSIAWEAYLDCVIDAGTEDRKSSVEPRPAAKVNDSRHRR